MNLVDLSSFIAGVQRRQQLRAGRRPREPVLQQQESEGRGPARCFAVFCPRPRARVRQRREGRMGLQGPQADDQDPRQARQLRGDDDPLQAAAHLHEVGRDAKLQREVDQLDLGQHFDFQKRQYWNL